MSRWRPALGMARRDLLRHKVRAALTCVLVALPILVATVAGQIANNQKGDNERQAHDLMSDADAAVVVSEFTAVRRQAALSGEQVKARGAEKRDPASVDVAALLPPGSKLAPSPLYTEAGLTTGGRVEVLRADLSNPMAKGLAEIPSGRAPTAPDEIAIPEAAARELGLLTAAGVPEQGATLDLVGGIELKVVGTVARVNGASFSGLDILAPSDSVIPVSEDTADSNPPSYLVDLPELTRTQAKALVSELAAKGIALQSRDAIIHPEAWGLPSYQKPIDLTPILVGALCILVGLIEVVLLVGAAFSVAARRQIRDLGLLSANGGAVSDVRRVLLAQGLVLGVLSSVVGAALGVLSFRLGADTIEHLFSIDLWRREISWPSVVIIGLLGSLTSVVAALLPGWKISRLTPVESLSGRFPIKAGESRAHRPAFVLAGGGLLVLMAAGFATAKADKDYPNWVGTSVMVAGLGLVLLVVGAVWCTPYVARRVSSLGRGLPLSGRYAFRDAGRHRFRTAAAVMALMITVAGAVLAGFGFSSAAQAHDGFETLAPNTLQVEAAMGDVDAARDTVERIVHPVEVASSFQLTQRGHEHRMLEIDRVGDTVRVVDEASLHLLVRLDDNALKTFRDGGVLTTYRGVVRNDRVGLTLRPGARQPGSHWTLPGAVVVAASGVTPYTFPTYIGEETANRLGLVKSYGSMVVRANHPITQEMIDRLSVYGLYGWSNDPDRALMSRLQYAGLGAAGLLTALVVGIAVAMAAAESRDDVATLAAVGAGPWRRRGFGAMHGLFLGIVGCLLGVGIGVPAGLSFTQVDGLAGFDVPWLATGGTVLVVLLLSWVIGAVVTPSHFRLTRRTA
jgi:putative ABC transport system permease protein